MTEQNYFDKLLILLNMNNRKDLIKLRPIISTITVEKHSNPAEGFQNTCLRPILKFQNELLLEIFRANIILRKSTYRELKEPKQVAYIEQCIRKDLKFKNLLIGTIIGQFTLEEWEVYVQHEKELKRRIVNLLIQRLQDQYKDL